MGIKSVTKLGKAKAIREFKAIWNYFKGDGMRLQQDYLRQFN